MNWIFEAYAETYRSALLIPRSNRSHAAAAATGAARSTATAAWTPT